MYLTKLFIEVFVEVHGCFEVNDFCARCAQNGWLNTDSKSEKCLCTLRCGDSPQGRAGDTFTIGVFPVGEDAKYANFLVGVVVVWEKEDVGLVVIVSGQNSTNKFDNGSEKLKETVVNAMASIGEEATSLIEDLLKP